MKRCVAVLVLALHVMAQPAYAWDDVGHQVITRIAWEHMTSRARAAALTLLSRAPSDSGMSELRPAGASERRDRDFFVRASTWADLVRDTSRAERYRSYHRGAWHFINFFFEDTPRGFRDRPDLPPDTVHVVGRLSELERSIVDPRRSPAERAVDLAWILHLVADIHQPLHATAQVTSSAPRGDQGGNLFRLNGSANLHGYWDSLIRRGNPRMPRENEGEYIDRVARTIGRVHPRSDFSREISNRNFEHWARASFEMAKDHVYATPPGQTPSEEYRIASVHQAERVAAIAGYRMADLLNRTIGR